MCVVFPDNDVLGLAHFADLFLKFMYLCDITSGFVKCQVIAIKNMCEEI